MSVYVNFLINIGVDLGLLGVKLKKLFELVIGVFEIKVEIFVWKLVVIIVWKLVKKSYGNVF